MKFLKGFAIAILCIVFSITMFGLTISIAVKDIVQNQLFTTAIKEAVTENVTNEEEKKVINEYVDKFTSDPELNDIVDSVLNDFVNGKEVSDSTVDKIISFLNNHKTEVEKFSNEDIDFKELNSQKTKDEIKKAINDGFQEVDTTDGAEVSARDFITLYTAATSNTYWYALSVVLVIIAALIALVSWSFYAWLKPVGITTIVTAVYTLVGYAFLTVIFTAIASDTSININLDSRVLLIAGITEFVAGVVFVVIFGILSKRENSIITDVGVPKLDDPVITNQEPKL